MKIYYITGVSGSGKSAVCRELTNRGFLAYDGDENQITGWKEKKYGKFVNAADRIPGPNGSKIELYEWFMSKDRVMELSKTKDHEVMFICGTANNRYEFWNLFEAVFCLTVDEEILKHRLATRKSNDFGKDPQDLLDILSWHKSSIETDKEAGAIIIDGNKDIETVVDNIIGHLS